MRRLVITPLKNITFRSFLISIVVTTVIIQEVLVNRIQSWRWPSLPHPHRGIDEEMRILFVSDPQVVGLQDEPFFPLGAVTRWDSDRVFVMLGSYQGTQLFPNMNSNTSSRDVPCDFGWTKGDMLAPSAGTRVITFPNGLTKPALKTQLPPGSVADTLASFLKRNFALAFSYARPDVVVFLGDLMDEGSKAQPSEYESYLGRLENIFYPAVNTKKIYVPGDNDIGGEGSDFRTKFKTTRFQSYFENMTGVVRHGFIDFLKLDLRFNKPPPLDHRVELNRMKKQLTAPLRIIINHESMLPNLKSFIYPILMEVQPHLLMSGHWHQSRLFLCKDCLSDNANSAHWPVHQVDWTNMDHYKEFDLNKPLAVHEIMVPTCSYRMGEKNMGYGVALIDPEGRLHYTVLWLPSRYVQLYAYIIILVLIFVIYVTCKIIQLVQPPTHRYTHMYR